MDIGLIDYWAHHGQSILHRASAPAKLAAAGMIVGGVVATGSLVILLTIYLFVAAAIVTTRLPALKIIAIAAYPALFAVPFALSRWDGSFLNLAIIVLRPLAIALTTLMVLITTPYPEVFATIQVVLPRVVGDGLFLTYRTLFIVLGLLGDIWTALRLRGGLRRGRYVRNVINISSGLGLLMLRTLALSERLYAVMRIRGYAGRLTVKRRLWTRSADDLYPLGLGVSLAGLSVATIIWPASLTAYGIYVLLAALVCLVGAIAQTWTTTPKSAKGD